MKLTKNSLVLQKNEGEQKKAEEERSNLDIEIPEFLCNDPEESKAYLKVHMLGLLLDKSGDGLS